MSLRIKCFVSGKMWLSGKGCRHRHGINDKVAMNIQCPTPRELTGQDFCVFGFFFLF